MSTTNTTRSSREIQTAFEAKGCQVSIAGLGHSYRAGGEIFIYALGNAFAALGL